MDLEMRRELARQAFQEKIRKVGLLIQLSAKLKVQRAVSKKSLSAAGTEPMGIARRRRAGRKAE